MPVCAGNPFTVTLLFCVQAFRRRIWHVKATHPTPSLLPFRSWAASKERIFSSAFPVSSENACPCGNVLLFGWRGSIQENVRNLDSQVDKKQKWNIIGECGSCGLMCGSTSSFFFIFYQLCNCFLTVDLGIS